MKKEREKEDAYIAKSFIIPCQKTLPCVLGLARRSRRAFCTLIT